MQMQKHIIAFIAYMSAYVQYQVKNEYILKNVTIPF